MDVMRAATLLLLLTACLSSPDQAGGGEEPDAGDPGGCPGNLVDNGSFEAGTSGWASVGATAQKVAGGQAGESAAEVCAEDGSGLDYYSFDDQPATIPEPRTGQTYQLTAWVRAGGNGALQTVEVVVREWDETGPHPSQTAVSPDGEWQEVSSELTVQAGEPTEVDVYFAGSDPAPGNCFQVDAVCLQLVE
jgi:hypothetical protein